MILNKYDFIIKVDNHFRINKHTPSYKMLVNSVNVRFEPINKTLKKNIASKPIIKVK